jgi:coenzyme F420-reducing hydrogenase beta subunit
MPKLINIKNQLEENKLVLYIGSPCQIWSLKKYLNKEYDNLITVDFKCYGFSDTKILSDFISQYENKYQSKIVKMDMRPNHKQKCLIEFENGIKIYDNNSWNIFLGNITERCKKCKFNHGKKNNYSDITIGDFWENRKNKLCLSEDFNPSNGVNSIYINTEKGYKLFNELKNNLEYVVVSK